LQLNVRDHGYGAVEDLTENIGESFGIKRQGLTGEIEPEDFALRNALEIVWQKLQEARRDQFGRGRILDALMA
jgi:hypothetical protein